MGITPKHVTCPLCGIEYKFLGSPAVCECGYKLLFAKMTLRAVYESLRKEKRRVRGERMKMKIELTEEQVSMLRAACILTVKQYGECAKAVFFDDHELSETLKGKAEAYGELFCVLRSQEEGEKCNEAKEV